MLDQLVEAYKELGDVNSDVIKKQKEYITKLENYTVQLETTVYELKDLIDKLLGSLKKAS